ncbi:MAG: AIPR family protein, partial [Rhodospirillales bacterium]|nr:AIPR family protein [Rhodospirillales bacterium]
MSAALDSPLEECAEWLTDGGNDAGVDGLHTADVAGNEFIVTIFQGKYKVKDLSGSANFPENGVKLAMNTVQTLFDPDRKVALNEKIAPKIADVRSLIRDGYIPTVRVVLCNNGKRWTGQAEPQIREAERLYGGQLEFRHFNHDAVVRSLKEGERIDANVELKGKAIVEDMNFMRVLVGRVAAHEVKRLFDEHGDQLLQRNIRRFLGRNNRVNADIGNTLRQKEKSDRFYFLNNGITVVCERFDYNAFQTSDYQVRLK